MGAGERNQKITIQRPVTSARGGMGSVTTEWVDVATIWAGITPVERPDEFFSAQQVQTKSPAVIKILHLDGLRTTMRVRHLAELGSPTIYRYYAIEAVVPIDMRRREIHLMCTARESDGFRS